MYEPAEILQRIDDNLALSRAPAWEPQAAARAAREPAATPALAATGGRHG